EKGDRQAMLARARFGMDRLNRYGSLYYAGGKRPLQEELKDYNPWELEDDEALTLVGGHIRKVTLPEHYDVMKLLRLVASDYRASGIAAQSQYGLGLYYQTRQQYVPALAEYDKLKEEFPQSNWTNNAQRQIDRIKATQIRLSQTGVQLPEKPAEIQVTYRNADRVWFVARKIDLKGFLEHIRENVIDDNRKRSWQWSLRRWHNYFMRSRARRYSDHWIYKSAADHLGEEVARWSDKIKDDGTHRYSHANLQSPLKDAGAYLVYAYDSNPPKDAAKTSGMNLLTLGDSRAVVVLTDLAIVEKKTSDGKLYYIADAAGGQPVPQANVNVMEVWSERQKRQTKYYKKQHELTTNTEGMTFLTSKKKEQTEFGPDQSVQQMRSRSYAHLLVSAGTNRLAWTGMRYYHRYHPSRMRSGRFAYVITDRPVYRPEQTVNFKIWMRQMHNGQLQNTPNHQISITIYDPKGNKIHNESGRTDQYGGYDGKFTLEEEPRLGVYRIYIHGRRYVGGQNFRVEEYKKPEFEVTVEPGTKHAKLGEKIKAQIKAEYYFGAPVTDATVKYRIFREEYTHRNYPHGYWDWLYGPGYGYAWYDYEWFPWWRKVRGCWAPPHWWWNHYGYSRPNPVRELVKQGQGHIGPDGTLDVEIDTGPALRQHGDLDHRYVIKAEVRDASRRVITGEGSVKVTRQAYYAYVNADGGWYRPGEEMQVTVRCLTPGNEPVQTEGVVTVSRVVLGGPNNAKIKEEELKRWKAETDKRGILKFRLRHERSDQLKIKFQAPDKWGGSVEGYGLVWVCGRDFDGKLYRFNNLELITDKRTYQPGETCHLMINTRHKDSYVIFADEVDNNHLVSWDLLHLPDGHKVLEIPIKKEHEPNFFLEATTVAGTRVHQQAKRICVPPEKKVVKVNVKSDKPEYRPGEKAKIHIEAKDLNDNPVNAQVCLTAFDKSVLYIQPEYTPEIKKFFHGNLRHHSLQMRTNLLEQFSAVGSVSRPFQYIHPTPPEWNGIWGTRLGDWRTVQPGALQQLEAGAGGAVNGALGHSYARKGGRGRLAREATADSVAAAPAGAEMEKKAKRSDKDEEAGASEKSFAEAEVRKQFADTAIWLTDVQTGQDGKASVTVDMPENLTTWKINSWAMTQKTRVGQASTQAITTKNLIVRLQAPRFFLEYDEVVISANVHNYLGEDKTARVTLDVPEKFLQMMEGYKAQRTVQVPADGEKRVDWRVKVLKEGTAKITVKALTDEESDAMQMTFPVLVHGMTKQVAKTGSMRPHEKQATHTITLNVPEKRRPELTHLEIQYAPSLVGAMLDALPYCLDYPYGCTEQTMSRFLPAVLTLKTLQNMGINLEKVRKARGRMDEIRRIEEGENIKIYGSYAENPVFDSKKMNKIIKKGLKRIADMQHGDGGWAWWKRGDSSGYLTSYVTYSLLEAQKADVKVDQNMLRRGLQFLKRWEEGEMRKNWWSPHARHAFACYVLSQKKMRPKIKPGKKDDRPGDGLDRLYKGRDKLNLYGKALLSMALANLDDTKRAETVLQNIMQYREENKETEMVWFRTPDRGWWYWWNNDIETNAWILRAIIRLQPKSDDAPKLVKWLLENP
ncbi:MAG: hypothetical protein KGZ25_08895, partial [Planctomycetes bacterium]|nr:hypothetical protein [Planctomycetota bacterium]